MNDDSTLPAKPGAAARSGERDHSADFPRDWERYAFDGFLGEGAMGLVFRARDRRLGRLVAVKLVRGDDPMRDARLAREASAQARVDHPNVCKVYEVGEVGGRPFIAMQLIDGKTLAEHELNLQEKLRALQQVAEGLAAAHALGIVHRDLKPTNIMCERERDGSLRPYVMDFGLARDPGDATLTQANTVVGTPSFMPPEQARGDRGTIDARSDVYALGATLYALLSGRPPLTGASATEVLMRVLHEEPPRLRKLVPSLPVDVESIAMKCLEKDPARRYASARALADDLARFLQGQPIAARPPSRIYRWRLAVRRNRTVAATGLVTAVMAVSLVGSLVKARIEARRVAQLAQRFGGAASEIEQRMRLAALMPEHDIGRDRRQLRERLEALAAETAAAGAIAEGPARYALGRGHLALGELAAARTDLERAWKLGYRPAETAAALGAVWERLWEGDRDESSREGARESSKQAERETRERVAGWLRLARGAPQVDSGLLEARIDYFQERIPQARDEAHAVFDRDPQQWEALLLEGRASSKLGHRLAGDGALAEARAHYARAETALTLAATIARSDPDVQYELCRLYDRILEVQAGRDGVAVEACRRAALVDPSSEAAQGKLAIALNRLVEKVHPPDSAALLDEAQRAAERAVAQAPRFANHYRVLANSLRLRGDFDGACAVIERGLRADPDSKSAEKLLLTEAQIEVARGHALLSRHEDAEGAVKAAQAAIDRARAHARADDFRIQVATTGVRVLAAAAAPPAQRPAAVAAARADLARTLAVTKEETPALRELAAELDALSR